ncbi:MAG: family 1 glycosylhydrolase, partial [Angelakisella sp.]
MLRFSDDFDWGIASSAYQIEGGWDADGKGPSIWDSFCKSGTIAGGGCGDVCCDHYHRWPEDIQLISNLGVKSYRLSMAWSRVLPEGTGQINEKGLDFYEKVVEALLKAGVEPIINLHHYDLP